MPIFNGPAAGRSRLGREIALALTFKLILLTALWFLVFKPNPAVPKATVTDLFAVPSLTSSHPENPAHVR
mgnify:CR=1 FL=1